jgi:hypothetical protein
MQQRLMLRRCSTRRRAVIAAIGSTLLRATGITKPMQ